MILAIGCDHAATEMKDIIKDYLTKQGYTMKDYGNYLGEKEEYPIIGERVAHAVVNGEADQGILFCGTGVGISLAANKVKGIRACVCSEPYTAKLSKQHNNTNILAMGARVIGDEMAKMIVDQWIHAEFEGGRHARRTDMVMEIENKD